MYGVDVVEQICSTSFRKLSPKFEWKGHNLSRAAVWDSGKRRLELFCTSRTPNCESLVQWHFSCDKSAKFQFKMLDFVKEFVASKDGLLQISENVLSTFIKKESIQEFYDVDKTPLGRYEVFVIFILLSNHYADIIMITWWFNELGIWWCQKLLTIIIVIIFHNPLGANPLLGRNYLQWERIFSFLLECGKFWLLTFYQLLGTPLYVVKPSIFCFYLKKYNALILESKGWNRRK